MLSGETASSRRLARATRSRLGALPVLALVVAAAVVGALHGVFTDLSVYRFAGHAALEGGPVYGTRDPATDLRFTYPPFAAVLMTPLAPLPAWAAAGLWTATSMGALAGSVAVVRRALGRPRPGWLVALAAGGAIGLEPVWQNLAFGQVNLLLMLVVLLDLLGPQRRWSGVLVGVAAGVKLTPLVFVVLLLLVGRRAAAGRAALTFAATVVAGFVLMPGSAASYWTDDVLRAGRVGPPALAHNQSVNGALTRLLDVPAPTMLWVVVAGPVAIAMLLAAARCWNGGAHVLGTGVAALSMLLASPVSWSHHWVWAVPIAIALWERSRLGAIAWTALFVARPILWPPWGQGREYDWNAFEHVVGNAYLLAALVVAAAVGLNGLARARRPRAHTDRSGLQRTQ